MKKNIEEIPFVISNLERIFRALNQYSKSADKLSDLTGPQRLALRTLANSMPMKVSDLARKMCLHPSTIVGVLDRLEKKCLVTRTRSTEDRRTVYVEITSQAEIVISDSPEEVQIILAKKLEALPKEQFDIVVKGLELIAEMLIVGNSSPQPLPN